MGLVLNAPGNGTDLARHVAAVAAGRVHKLKDFQVDGLHPLTPAAADGILRYLERCPVRDNAPHAEEAAVTEAAATAPRQTIRDIDKGFYATPSRTGNNDLDFWKVNVTPKGFRNVKRVIGGGTDKYPKLVEISGEAQKGALGAILRAGIEEAANTYADKQERCKRCGLHLTDEVSRRDRMGKTCKEKSS